MNKVAKIVCVSLMTRVVVDENATDEQIIELAKGKFKEKIECPDCDYVSDPCDFPDLNYV